MAISKIAMSLIPPSLPENIQDIRHFCNIAFLIFSSKPVVPVVHKFLKPVVKNLTKKLKFPYSSMKN